ncbi:MAG: hypothetical protein D3914_15280, partial [Candidatus Electrothrix sp. LOE2]|nr:hypothetical protein [Candidatus Electrothrix sp. LOE2]
MNYKEDIIRYRLERAEETYLEALLMQREKHWYTCANRLYSTCFQESCIRIPFFIISFRKPPWSCFVSRRTGSILSSLS